MRIQSILLAGTFVMSVSASAGRLGAEQTRPSQERRDIPARSSVFPARGFDCTGCPSDDDRVYKVVFSPPVGQTGGSFYPLNFIACIRNPVMVGEEWFESDFIGANLAEPCTKRSFEDQSGKKIAKHGFLRLRDVLEVFTDLSGAAAGR